MVRTIALGLLIGMTVPGHAAVSRAEVRTPPERSRARAVALPAVNRPVQESTRRAGRGTIQGLGEFRAAQTWDNRVKVAMTTAEFDFGRVTADTGETEITIGGKGEDALTIRFGGADGLIVEKGGRMINVRRGEDTSEAVRRLVGGHALTAFRQHVGRYERQLANETGFRKKDPLDPYAYTFMLTAAFVGELAGDPNAIGRSRELIRRRILSARERPQQAGFTMRQGGECFMNYEQALLNNDTRNSQCMDAANSVEWYLRGAERLLCAAEFLSGAVGAESSYVGCMGMAGLKLV